MRRNLLTVLVCFFVATTLVSCDKADVLTDVESTFNIMEETADKSLPAPAIKKEQTIDLSKTEKEEAVKVEKSLEKNESSKVSITDEVNNRLETEKPDKDVLECVLSVRCDTVLKNIDELDKEKVDILPQDGIIFPRTEVVFYEGESVFNVLKRELKKKKIHIDFVNTPMYNTVYIRGISNLYERNCGELSGWIYKVNGVVPGYGCSQYILNDGDKIEFVYTCNLGKDVN